MGTETTQFLELIRVRNVEKSYGATHVLKGVDFTVRSGEIHALLGGNGAGKSTLIRIVTGRTHKDAGEVATASGRTDKGPVLAVVHQELALLPDMTVAENISLVHTRAAFSFARHSAGREIALKALKLIDADLAKKVVDLPARALSLHEGQIVEIARALSTGAEVLLLDEPTANLTAHETATLFTLLKRLVKEEGIGVVFVSHRMKEIRQLCDRCTIIRDGKSVVVGEPVSSLSDNDIVRHMGQPAHRAAESFERNAEPVSTDAIRLRSGDSEIVLPAGTIVGLAGSPSGPSALIDALVGSANNPVWTIEGRGLPRRFSSPSKAIRAGIGFVSGDRTTKGVLAQLPIIDNVLAARRVRQGRALVRAGETKECFDLVSALGLKAGSIWDAPRSLSGGNQQKLLVARWLGQTLRLMVLEEPTRGVDIGTKRDIYQLIRQTADLGTTIVWWSTESAELIELCDDIYAFDPEGHPAGLLAKDNFTEDGIAQLTGMAA